MRFAWRITLQASVSVRTSRCPGICGSTAIDLTADFSVSVWQVAESRDILRRITRGDLQPAFQAALDADLAADPLLGGEYPDQPD
jgi:hypothetical protein